MQEALNDVWLGYLFCSVAASGSMWAWKKNVHAGLVLFQLMMAAWHFGLYHFGK